MEQAYNSGKNREDFLLHPSSGILLLLSDETDCQYHIMLFLFPPWVAETFQMGEKKQNPKAIKNKQKIHNDLLKHIFKGSTSLFF